MILRKIKTLRIKEVNHLAKHLGTNPSELKKICDTISSSPQKYCFQWPKKFKNGKTRPMVKVFGRLREIQERLKGLLQRIELLSYVHGGVPACSTRSNAEPHLNNKAMLLCTDLENHFPKVSPKKVYKMFRYNQECSPDVARILTRLTTLNGRLPQGYLTSTIVSNLVTIDLSKRLHDFAKVRGVKCTQYVDDYSFSGSRKFARRINNIIKIASQEGFTINLSKTKVSFEDEEQIVTGIRVNSSRPDVPSSKINEVRQKIDELKQFTKYGKSITEKELKSLECKISYIGSLNRGSAKFLKRQLDHLKLSTCSCLLLGTVGLLKKPHCDG